MNKRIALSCLILLLATLSISAQPAIEWQKCFGGSEIEWANSIIQTNDGGYIVCGGSNSNDGDVTDNNGDLDCWIVKLSITGLIEWQQSLGGSKEDAATSIQQTNDNGFIIAGYSKSDNGDVTCNYGFFDYWIVKLSDSGEIDWQQCLGGSHDDVPTSIQQTNDGGYIVCGSTRSADGDITNNKGFFDYWIAKLTNIGEIEWQSSFGGSGADYARSVSQTIDGGYIIAGGSTSNDGDITGNHGNYDYWVVKLTNIGELEWQKSLGGSDNDYARFIQQTMDGGYILTGYTKSVDGDITEYHAEEDFWVVKLNNMGFIEWQRTAGGNGRDVGICIQQISEGGYIASGLSSSTDGDVTGNNGSEDFWVVNLNSVGAIDWQKSLGGTGIDNAYFIRQTTDNGYILAGQSESTDGDVSGNHGNKDFWVVKLEPDDIGVNEISEKKMLNIFPNPANSQVNVKTAGKLIGGVYTVYDYTGKAVLSEKINKENILIKLDNLSDGIYLLKIQTEEVVTSRFVKK